ncbi:hypothetical protein [Hansschlegelia plantiphila]|nr:hypothetical protein [Hansschlegelia plantiphila]
MAKFAEALEQAFIQAAGNEAGALRTQAANDAKDFLKRTAIEIPQWTYQYKSGQMSRMEYEGLMRGQVDLAHMHALLHAGLSAAAAERLRKKLIELSIDLAIKFLI